MEGRRAFGQKSSVCVWSLSVFAGGPTGLTLKRCLDCTSGVTQGITGHMEEERGDWVKEGWLLVDGQMDLCISQRLIYWHGSVSEAEKRRGVETERVEEEKESDRKKDGD